MQKEFFNFINGRNSISEFANTIRQGIPSAVFGVTESFKSYLISIIEDKVLFVVKDELSANAYAEYIRSFSDKKTVILTAKDEILVANRAFSKDRLYKRISAIYQSKTADVIISTPEALMQIFPKNVASFTFEKDSDYLREDYINALISMGYKRVDAIESQGCFSVRGDILDLYPINAENPVKIDFFGDTIESIKRFDAKTREYFGSINKITAVQAVDVAFSKKDYSVIKTAINQDVKMAKGDIARLKTIADDAFSAMELNNMDALSVYSCLSENACDFTGLVDENTVVVLDEGKRLKDIAELSETEFKSRLKSLLSGGEVFAFEENNYIGYQKLKELLNKYRISAVQSLSSAIHFFDPLKIINPSISGVADYRADFREVYSDIRNWISGGYRIIVFATDFKRAEAFSNGLYNAGIGSAINPEKLDKGVSIITKNLTGGFVFHEEKTAILGSGNLFFQTASTQKKKTLKKQTFFTAPEAGDYCVHEVHGIGKVLGSKKISTSEGTKDYLAVEYHGGDVLYVPVEQLDILTRYLGGDKTPRLSKIGGLDFEKVKQNVKESIRKMSFDLKKLYEERNALIGFKFIPDNELESLFSKSFKFEDTPDQAVAIREIRKDMIAGKVMDRLVCGDVGFGKTEVAFRAIFLSIINGKQVAMLAPTTILTEQHYNTAIERFKDFGVKIACLNRFKTPKQQAKIIKDLENGEIDLIIGTHRLLSSDVKFKDLGLLVLDEEQRFGVEHKEKIKLLKKNVDTLTLTATPIPRTLHMSLSGIRSISTINTPPLKRLPVQTYVTEETPTLIADAIMREINRGGQAFILYNRVESIYSFADKIKKLLSNVKITIAHGQMEERVLEKSIMDFYKGESDLLISTTIIENGIDLPKANTLIVIDADRLGLSTLYQLKGRVGRSDRLAYAYFTFKRDKILSETAYNRLNAITEFTEMGSGIKIAMRDLEIRGAGNVLGVEQHGHMDKIGYELYSKLLKEEIEGKENIIAELDIRVSAFIPDKYIESRSQRMDVYKQIAELDGTASEKELRENLIDVYGELPKEVDNLINVAIVKSLAKTYGVKQINLTKNSMNLVFSHYKVFGEKTLQEAMEKSGVKTRVIMNEKPVLEFVKDGLNNEQSLLLMRKFLQFSEDNFKK